MINKESLIYDVLQKTNLEEELVKKFAESNQKFFEGINESIENISSYEAIDVISILISAYKYFVSRQQWEGLVYACLTKIREGIYNKEFNMISSFSGITYINFIIRELKKMIPELQRFSKTLEMLQNDILSYYLNLPENSEFYTQNGFELIQGFSGILKYY